GKKIEQKKYYRHSGYPGGAKRVPYERMLRDPPNRIITSAVKGMLPKSRLGDRFLHKLKVYAGPEHPHAAQLAGQAAGRMAEPAGAVV
ncbi:MAG: uL13 family ribosomal protein, partial [bacterium]